MESALNWQGRTNRLGEPIRLVFIKEGEPKAFCFNGLAASMYENGPFRGDESYFEFDLKSTVNELLSVDLRMLFERIAQLNKGFRTKYPAPRETWLTWKGDRDKVSEAKDFVLSLHAFGRCQGKRYSSEQIEDNHSRINDYEKLYEEFLDCVDACSNGDLSEASKNLLWDMVEFAFQDDIWLAQNGNPSADAELFCSWGIECQYINQVFADVVGLLRKMPGLYDGVCAFDQAIGLESLPKGDFRFALGEMNLGHGSSRFASSKRLELSQEIRSDYRSKDGFAKANDIGAAICGLIYLECMKLNEKETGLSLDCDEMKKLLNGYYCSSGSGKVDVLKQITEMGNAFSERAGAYEAKVNRSGRHSLLEPLSEILELAEEFFTHFYCEEVFSEYFDKAALGDSGFKLPKGFSSRAIKDKALNSQLRIRFLAIANTWEKISWGATVRTFPGLYAHLLSAILHMGFVPKRCECCDGLFLLEAPNQKYCKRTNSKTGIKCTDIERRKYKGKPSCNSKVQSINAKKDRAESKSREVADYYSGLAMFVRKVGKEYRESPFVGCPEYGEWLDTVVGPKYGAAAAMKPYERPFSMIWGGEILNGSEKVLISEGIAAKLSSVKSDSRCGKDWLKECSTSGPASEFQVRSASLLDRVLTYNKGRQDERLPIPGLVESELYRLEKIPDEPAESEKQAKPSAISLERFSPSYEKIEESDISR